MKDINPIINESKDNNKAGGSPLKIPEGSPSPKRPKIFKRFPLDKEVPVTIEYHFEEKADAENFKMPKKYKDNYDLLPITQERIRPVDSFRKTCPTTSFYRILQRKLNEITIGTSKPEKLYRCMYCGGDFSIVMRTEEGNRFCSWNCYEFFEKKKWKKKLGFK